MVMFRMLSGGRVATRLLATRHLLHVVGLIGRRAIATAAIFGAPIRRGRAMIGLDGIGGLRGTWGCGRNHNCGEQQFNCFFSRRLEELTDGQGCVIYVKSRWLP